MRAALILSRVGFSLKPTAGDLSNGVASRHFRSTSTTTETPATGSLSPRWLSDVKQRIGRCLTFGTDEHQTQQAGQVLSEIARDWRELVAGSEGFLTSAKRRGIYRQEVVWGEQDSMGHVNNVIYNRYAESGRVQWTQKLGMHVDPANRKAWRNIMSPSESGLILKSITTHFKFPMTWPDHISIYHKLRSEPTSGTSSFILDVVIMSELHQRPAARLVEDVVVYDYVQGKKIGLPPFMLDVFRETWKLQEEARARNSERVTRLLEDVRRLEQGTWDKSDAVEDMGSAKG
ncbi:hypothetical protein B0A55_11129 [Friedmanniomyces simplex]|uniref:Thioesterase domain-containing protein n=1 Tax=Friedmanniomyces simplex TaxID=329884 RepID=A0A4U0WSX2_9PEZI|nr:hypothetical protein B0A55_11129 [Friedmanniomyces simplex]